MRFNTKRILLIGTVVFLIVLVSQVLSSVNETSQQQQEVETTVNDQFISYIHTNTVGKSDAGILCDYTNESQKLTEVPTTFRFTDGNLTIDENGVLEQKPGKSRTHPFLNGTLVEAQLRTSMEDVRITNRFYILKCISGAYVQFVEGDEIPFPHSGN